VSAVAAPDRNLEQRMEALARANEIRSKRAQLKRDIKAGRLHVTALLADPPYWILTAKVYDLLMAAPKLGRVKVNKILSRARVASSKTVDGLTVRQREEIVALSRGLPIGRAPMRDASMECVA
jgi:hypothetical protein